MFLVLQFLKIPVNEKQKYLDINCEALLCLNFTINIETIINTKTFTGRQKII